MRLRLRLSRPFWRGQAGAGVGGRQRAAKDVGIDAVQEAACRAHPSPPARYGSKGVRGLFTIEFLQIVVEHEVHVRPVAGQRGEDSTGSAERCPVEMRCFARVVERKGEFTGLSRCHCQTWFLSPRGQDWRERPATTRRMKSLTCSGVVAKTNHHFRPRL